MIINYFRNSKIKKYIVFSVHCALAVKYSTVLQKCFVLNKWSWIVYNKQFCDCNLWSHCNKNHHSACQRVIKTKFRYSILLLRLCAGAYTSIISKWFCIAMQNRLWKVNMPIHWHYLAMWFWKRMLRLTFLPIEISKARAPSHLSH